MDPWPDRQWFPSGPSGYDRLVDYPTSAEIIVLTFGGKRIPKENVIFEIDFEELLIPGLV